MEGISGSAGVSEVRIVQTEEELFDSCDREHKVSLRL